MLHFYLATYEYLILLRHTEYFKVSPLYEGVQLFLREKWPGTMKRQMCPFLMDEENYDRWTSALLAVGMLPSADEFSYNNAR